MNSSAIADAAKNHGATTDSGTNLRRATASSPLLGSQLPSGHHDVRDHCPHAAAAAFVALSRFTVAHMSDQVKQAFQMRPHRVDDATGFLRMEVLSPCDAPDEIWLFTYWKDEPSYRAWHHSHLYKESHQGIPKGLRLVPKSVSIRFFEHVGS